MHARFTATHWATCHACACRALGDSDYKKPDQGVTANAEVRRVDMVVEDRAVIMGSDGLWDVLGDQEVVDTVEEVFKVSLARQSRCSRWRQSGAPVVQHGHLGTMGGDHSGGPCEIQVRSLGCTGEMRSLRTADLSLRIRAALPSRLQQSSACMPCCHQVRQRAD